MSNKGKKNYTLNTPMGAWNSQCQHEYSVDDGESWDNTTSARMQQNIGRQAYLDRILNGDVVTDKEGRLWRRKPTSS